MYKRVHRRLNDMLRDRRAWFVALAGGVSLALSSHMHGNAWHLLALLLFAVAFLVLLGVSRSRRLVSKPWLRSKAGDLVERLAIVLVVAGTFLPFVTMTMRGEPIWCELSLVGAITALMLAMDVLFESSRMALAVGVRIGALWVVLYAARHHFLTWHPHDITLVLLAGLIVSVSIAWEAVHRRSLTSWKTLIASAVLTVPHAIERFL